MDGIRRGRHWTANHGKCRHRRNAGGERHWHLFHPGDFLRRRKALRRPQTRARTAAGSGARRLNMKCAIILLAVFSAACTVGPNYHRPAVQVPESFRAPEPLPPAKAESLADLKWFEVFKDEDLQALIRTALQQNYDLRSAV